MRMNINQEAKFERGGKEQMVPQQLNSNWSGEANLMVVSLQFPMIDVVNLSTRNGLRCLLVRVSFCFARLKLLCVTLEAVSGGLGRCLLSFFPRRCLGIAVPLARVVSGLVARDQY